MEVVHERCCGLDVHERTVVACGRTPEGQQTRTDGPTAGELPARRGAKRARIALAHTLLVIVDHLLQDQTDYQELGANYDDERHREATVRRAVRRLERLGYTVTVAAA